MADIVEKKSVLAGKKKFIAYILGLIATIVLAFTGKLSLDGTQTLLIVITGGYWGVEGVIDLGKALMAKRSGTNGGATGQP